jgi:hypothetical protein
MHKTSWSVLWRPWLRRSSHKGGPSILLSSTFITTTAVFTSQKRQNSFSSRISCCMFPTYLIIPTWPVGLLAIRVYQDWTHWPKLRRARRIIRRCWRISDGIPPAELMAVFEGWIDRVRWVIAYNGQYYSSEMLCN